MIISSSNITWEKALEIIKSNDLGRLYRDQPTTDKYRDFKAHCQAHGLSVVQYIVKNRLEWVSPSGAIDVRPNTTTELFTDANDAKIIMNDFPYRFSSDIVHLVAWTKLEIASDPESEIGDVTEHTRAVIDKYVKKTFVDGFGIAMENIIWFRNFPALQSVAELSHVHVLIKDMGEEVLEKVLGTSGMVLTTEEVEEIHKKKL